MNTPATPTRPLLRYHGSKWRIAPWVISHFPQHRVYVEPFGGGGNILLRKPPCASEIYNDLDDELVNLLAVARDPDQSLRLAFLLEHTPFSRTEYERAREPTTDPVEQARRTLVKAWFGTRSKGLQQRTGFDTRINPGGNISRVNTFAKLPDLIPAYRHRLRRVVLENVPAIDLIPRMDREHVLFYLDPPYPASTRSGSYYRHEMTDDNHRALAEVLHSIQGNAIISGYPCDLYDKELYPDWTRDTLPAHTDGAKPRTETLWMNFQPRQLELEF